MTRGADGDAALASVVKSVWSRGLALGVAALFAFAASRLIITHYGPVAFANYALVSSVVSLLPFVDLGTGAAVTNAFSLAGDARDRDEVARGTLLSSFRAVTLSGAVLAIGAAIIGLLGSWHFILGNSVRSPLEDLVITLAIVVFGLSLPLALSQRVLLGIGKNHVQIACQGLQTPAAFALVVLAVVTRLPSAWLILCAYLGILVSVAVTQVFAGRLAELDVRYYLHAFARRKLYPGRSILHTAAPMLVVASLLPIAVQSDRLVLSHVTGAASVASYSLAAQIYTPVTAVIAAAGQALWPIFAKQRMRGRMAHLGRLVVIFSIAALAMSLILTALVPVFVHLVARGRIGISHETEIAFVVVGVATASQYPLGIWLTDQKGLRFQALMVAVALPINLVLSIWFARIAGTPGPLFATALVLVATQTLPYAFLVRHRRLTGETLCDASVPFEPVLDEPSY